MKPGSATVAQAETGFKRRVLKDLQTLADTWILKTQERSRRGVPDILLCLRGRFIAIELKVDDEVPTPLQKFTLQCIVRAHGTAFHTTPSRWPEHFEMLKTILAGLR